MRKALALLALLLLAFAGSYLLWPLQVEQPVQSVSIGGPFRLASAKGGVVDSDGLKGKPYGVFFGYTHCPDVCPTTLYDMSNALDTLGDEAKDFRLFFITVDPERDTAQVMKDYVSNFDPRIDGLIPTKDELTRILQAFHAVFEKVPDGQGGYTMNHTATVYLMGRDGTLQSTLTFGENPDTRIAKLKRLLAGG
ncbi:SCO family protein [Aestuariivirga sp.]|uniref:SCO family protein n=1 Tax=Aestuariivirga sp. TaxID=2650926 RepID=UPI0039E59081